MFEVVTEFSHIYFIPIAPWRSFVVRRLDSGKREGVRIPLRWKSVLLTWLRAGLVLTVIVSLIATMLVYASAMKEADLRSRTTTQEVEVSDSWHTPLYIALEASGLLLCTYLFRNLLNAKFQRAVELGRQLNLTDEEWTALEKHFGQPCPANVRTGAAPADYWRL